MRNQNFGGHGVNHVQLAAQISAGQGAAVALALRDQLGIALDGSLGVAGAYKGLIARHVLDTFDAEGKPSGKAFGDIDRVAMDAAEPTLVTTSNAGIPAFLSNYLDPKLIEVLVSPMKAAQIAGETKKGDWTTTVTTFVVGESTGEVASYGDYSNGGNADANFNYPQRQSFHYQTFTQWGEKELAVAGLAQIDLSSRKNVASALVLNKFQNKSYFFGISGLQNYGLLNSPDLPAAIVPTVTWSSATADQIFGDVIRLFQQLIGQLNGNIDQDSQLTMALSPTNSVNLNKTNTYNVNVFDQMRKNFPNLVVKTAPEYSTDSGELVQMFPNEVEGQETVTAAFTEKMRAHAIVVGSSNFSQKKSQGTWGTIMFLPAAFSQMLG